MRASKLRRGVGGGHLDGAMSAAPRSGLARNTPHLVDINEAYNDAR
jgi:hypothetical protein